MTRLVEKVLAILRPPPTRPIESTRNELAHEIVERRKLSRRTTKLSLMLADYRKADHVIRR